MSTNNMLPISVVIDSKFTSSVIDREFEPWSDGLSPGQIKPMTIKWVFASSNNLIVSNFDPNRTQTYDLPHLRRAHPTITPRMQFPSLRMSNLNVEVNNLDKFLFVVMVATMYRKCEKFNISYPV
jgi:hypothetical protein